MEQFPEFVGNHMVLFSLLVVMLGGAGFYVGILRGFSLLIFFVGLLCLFMLISLPFFFVGFPCCLLVLIFLVVKV